MIEFLAQAAKEARQAAGIKPARIAVAVDIDLSTIYRFEQGRWPRDADQIVAGYAEELNVPPMVLWDRAIEMWRATQGGSNNRRSHRN